jgi:hypothetical protein
MNNLFRNSNELIMIIRVIPNVKKHKNFSNTINKSKILHNQDSSKVGYIGIYYILSSNKGIFVWPIWPEVNCPYFHTPGKKTVIGLLQDHFHIEADKKSTRILAIQ